MMAKTRTISMPVKPLFLACLAAYLLLMAVPASAALQPHFFSGRVSAVDKDQASITIQTSSQGFTGSAPNIDAIRDLSPGEEVIAVSLGSRGGKWVFIGRLAAGEHVLTDAYGDIAFLPTEVCREASDAGGFCDARISGGYQVRYANTPDCGECTGCNCKAAGTRMTILGPDKQEFTPALKPGGIFTHTDAAYEIKIHFISGETPAYPECANQMCAGPQPISNFIVNIMPQNGETNGSGNGDGNCFISAALQKCIAFDG